MIPPLPVKTFLTFLLIVLSFASIHADPEKKRYVVYAQFKEDTMVDLSDGSKWAMDKGDCFPIYMYKEHQTKVVLQLGAATFWTDTKRVRVMKESEIDQAVASYQKNLENYIKIRRDPPNKEAELPK
jgi:hypothetical protein